MCARVPIRTGLALLILVGCGDQERRTPTDVAGPPLQFLLDGLTQQDLVREHPPAAPWESVTLSRDAFGPETVHPNGTRSRPLPLPLDKNAAGAPALARWRAADGSPLQDARILPARRTVMLADLEAFRQQPFWTSSDGQKLPLFEAAGAHPFEVPLLGPETHATLTAGYGPGAGATRPERPPSLRIDAGGRTLARLVLPADGRAGDQVRFALPAEAGTFTLHVEHAAARGGESLSLRSLNLEVEDGLDRVVEPEGLAADATLEVLPRAPRPVTPLSGRPGTMEAVLTAVLAPGTVALCAPRNLPFEVTVNGTVVARSDTPVAELTFPCTRLQVARVAARSLAGPWPGPPLLVQPAAVPSLALPGVRGRESSTPGALDIRHLSLGMDTRRCLLVEPGTVVNAPTQLPGSGRLEMDLGLLDLGPSRADERTRVQALALLDGAEPRRLGEWDLSTKDGWRAVSVDLEPELRGAALRLQVMAAEPATQRARLRRVALAEPRLVQPTADRPPNVLVYLVDTLRADHLGCYGYQRPTSPALDALAEDGILFEQAGSQSSWTKPSVATVFTGLIQSFHGVTRDTSVPADVTTLAEWLRQHDYQTAAFLANPQVFSEGLNFEQGFGTFVALLGRDEDPRAADVNALALPWLRAHQDRPFFLYLHTLDPHDPYDPPAATAGRFSGSYAGPLTPKKTLVRDLQDEDATTPEDLQYLLDLYDEEILANDQEFGRVLEELRTLGLYENTVILFLSDHGEEFRDHGKLGHGRTLYQECLHVPFVWKPAGTDHPKGARVTRRVPLTSVFPTLASLVGHPLPAGLVQGQDVSPFWQGGGEDLPLVAEHRRHLRSLVQDHKKVIENSMQPDAPREELFDLGADPREQIELSGERPDRVRSLLDLLDSLLARDRAAGLGRNEGAVEVHLTEEQKALLRALGYLQDDS